MSAYEYIRAGVLSACLIAAAASPASADTMTTFRYSFGGVITVSAPENAAADMKVGLWARMTVDPSGNVSGDGVIRYETIEPCAWEPPNPENGTAPHCRIHDLVDGTFTVSGSVLDYIDRGNDGHALKDAVFALADPHASTRSDRAPLRLRLKLAIMAQPRELLSLTGFSTPGANEKYTGAAVAGLFTSTLFNHEFEISPIALTYQGSGDNTAEIQANGRYDFGGSYTGNPPVNGEGSVFFMQLDPNKLPGRTDPGIYSQTPANKSQPRAFTEWQQQAEKVYRSLEYQPPLRLKPLEAGQPSEIEPTS